MPSNPSETTKTTDSAKLNSLKSANHETKESKLNPSSTITITDVTLKSKADDRLNQIESVMRDGGMDSMSVIKSMERMKEILETE